MRKFNTTFPQESVEEDKVSNEAPRISVFPQDQSDWRIDWFGEVAFPDRSARRKQPSVLVHLSKVTDDRFTTDPSILLSPLCTGPAWLQKKVWISVGTMVLIRIGDIWRNGQLVVRPDYELEQFSKVKIDKASTSIIKAGLNLNESGFLLPMGEHPWHMQCTQSYCLMIQLPQERRLIIPCMELVRFYFGSSSTLLTKLFLPPLIRESLFSSASIDPASRMLRIDLADKMPGTSAADIGRCSMDRVAAHAAKVIGDSCLRASIVGEPIYPLALFPFDGRTDLIASGRWLSYGGLPMSTFLVYSLRSCSHPFPFRSLRYTTRGIQARTKSGPPSEPSGLKPKQQQQSAAQAKNSALVERDPSSNLTRKIQRFKDAPRFTDLERKCIWRDKTLNLDSNSSTVAGPAAPSVDSIAVGDAGSNQRVRPVDLAIVTNASAWKPESVPAFLKGTVEDLRHFACVTVELLTESQDDGWTVPISTLTDEDGEINPKLMILDSDNKHRMRRTAIFAFKHDTEHVCAVVIESDPLHTKIYTTTGQSELEVWTTLRCAAHDFVKDAHNEALDSPLSDLIRWVFEIDVVPELHNS